jgi:cysteine desulfurase
MTLMNLLDDYDICVGTGSACSTESDKPSHVALAYGLTSEEALECIRFSLGHETTYDELNYVAQVVKGLIQTLR